MKKVITSFLMLLLTVTLFAQNNGEMEPEAAKFYNEGNKLMRTGAYNDAIAQYESALKTSNDYRIHYQKGVTLKKIGKYDEAIAALNACIKSNPDAYFGYNALGGIYFQQGQYQLAIDNFTQFEAKAPKNNLKNQAKEYISRSYTKMGAAEKTNGNFEQAVNYLNTAVANFKFDAAYLLLAEVLIDLGRYDEALTAADNALNSRKTITVGGPLYYKGKAFKGKNDLTKAKEAFEAGRKDATYKKLCDYELDMLK